MGLFDKKPKAPEAAALPKITERDALAWMALAIVGADGDVTEAELTELTTLLMQLKAFQRDQAIIQGTLQRAVELAQQFPEDGMLRAMEAIPASRRAAAFIFAADLVFATGAGEKEKGVLEALHALLGVDEETGRKVVEVMTLKHAA